MGMKSVELNVEDSKEFMTLLEKSAEPEEIEAFLLDKASGDVPTELVAALEKMAQLDQLQEDELTILARIGTVRREMQGELVELLLASGKDVKTDVKADGTEDADREAETDLSPPEETSPISTDQKTPS